jgi:hypothetical protein
MASPATGFPPLSEGMACDRGTARARFSMNYYITGPPDRFFGAGKPLPGGPAFRTKDYFLPAFERMRAGRDPNSRTKGQVPKQQLAFPPIIVIWIQWTGRVELRDGFL